MLHDNPRPFYESAISGPTIANEELDKFDPEHRFPLVLNLSTHTIRRFLSNRDSHQHVREWVKTDWGPQYLPLLDYALNTVLNLPKRPLPYPSGTFDPQEFGWFMTVLPSTVFSRYQWSANEFAEWVDFLCTLDHAKHCPTCNPHEA